MVIESREMRTRGSIVMMDKHVSLHAAHGLSFDERRLIYAALSKIDGRIGGKRTYVKTITITAEEYSELFGIDLKHAYSDMKDASLDLYERSIVFIERLTKSKMIRSKYRWLCSIHHHEGEGKVSLSFNPELERFFTELKNNYTIYKIDELVGLRSIYSQRMAEIVLTYEKTGWWKTSVADFCDIMEAPPSCRKTFQHLKQVIIERVVSDLRKKNWIIEWKGIKKSRSFVSLEFRFKRNPQLSLVEG